MLRKRLFLIYIFANNKLKSSRAQSYEKKYNNAKNIIKKRKKLLCGHTEVKHPHIPTMNCVGCTFAAYVYFFSNFLCTLK